jgi:peptidoglycan/xylan/chitin deacetylase (PgdA/CDA1 family)
MSADSQAVEASQGGRVLARLRALAIPGRWKGGLAAGFEAAGLNAAGLALQKMLLHPWARALNYHDVPASLANAFEQQLCFFARHFVPVGPGELRQLHAGRWPHPKPGLLLTFDDGLRSHADVVAPLLEKYGFRGWFNVPVGFVDAPPAEQQAFARRNHIGFEPPARTDERIALSWNDLLRLDSGHEICCHTWSHRRLTFDLTADDLELEIDQAKRRLEEMLGHEVRAFAWVGGEEWAYSRAAAERIREAKFEISFMTNNAVIRPDEDLLQVQRTNVEAHFDPALLRLCLSGFYDLLYLRKRRRVNRRTAIPTG